jgi:hypothetical protein
LPGTLFTTKIDGGRLNSTDGLNSSHRTFWNFETFALSVPLNKGNGWILDLSLHNYSRMNYDTKFSSSSLGEDYTQYFNGSGGIERLSAGFSYIILKYFSFGLQFNYAFGNIAKATYIDFANPILQDTKNIISDEVRGFYFNTGLIFHGFGKIFKSKKLDNLTLGVNFSTPFTMNSTIHGYFTKSTQTDSVVLTEGKVNMPYALGIGVANDFGKLLVSADVYMQNWNSFKYYGVHPSEIQNNFRAGLGLEFTPSKRFTDPYYARISYRIGGNYTMDNLELYGERIKAYGIAAGLSLPISRYNGVDLVFSYVTRGKASNGLIKDNVFRLGASVNIGELWFLRQSDDF